MENNNKEVLVEMFNKLYSEDNRKEIEHIIVKLKTELENLAGVDAFVTARVKSPISIIKKFNSEEKYHENWNSMKDLIGLMVVVEKNNDVDDIIFYLEEEYSKFKNPNSTKLYKDYRKIDIRKDHSNNAVKINNEYDPPSDKGYQTSDGYKNVRVNLMLGEYPIEIQIKTKEQYVAHEATHDPVYKAPSVEDQDIRQMISDKLFPYFEANAHLMFHDKEMSSREKKDWKLDIIKIINRNTNCYQEYSDIYEDACRVYALYLFMTKNMKNIYKSATFSNNPLDLKLLEIEVKRVFHYIEKQIAVNNQSLTAGQVFNRAVNEVANMTYDKFIDIRSKIAGEYRCDKCIVSGVYDLLRAKDVELIKRLSESFREVEIAVYDDELAEIYANKKPMFNLEERKSALKMVKGISTIKTIGADGKIQKESELPFVSLNPFEEDSVVVNMVPRNKTDLLKRHTDKELEDLQQVMKQKTFKVGYLPGVFDMLHPGHIEYINQVCKLCEYVIIGSKTDQYVEIIKNKKPVLDAEERQIILKSLRGIEGVLFTDFDITPPEDVLELMKKSSKNNQRCAIFMGSDWIEKANEKNSRSISEYDNLVENYPNIELISVPRGHSGRSSTNYKARGLEGKKEQNPYEFTILNR